MDKCLECGSELTQTVGKRKKLYCGNTCRVKYFLKKKNEGRIYKKRGRKPKSEKSDAHKTTPSNSKWDFSKVDSFFQVEDFTEYPKDKCPASGFQRTEYLMKKKESDDKIREAYRIYKSNNNQYGK